MKPINMRRLLDIALARLQKGEIVDLDDAAVEAAGGAEKYFDIVIASAIANQRKPIIAELRETQAQIEPQEDMLPLGLHIPKFIIAGSEILAAEKATVKQFRRDAASRLRHDRRRVLTDEEQIRTGKLLSEAVDGDEEKTVGEAIKKHIELVKLEAERQAQQTAVEDEPEDVPEP